MKRLILLLLFPLCCFAQTIPGNSSLTGNAVWTPGPIPVIVPTFVQAAPIGSNSGVATIPFTFSGNVTSGNTIYIWGCWNDATATFTNFSKTAGTSTVGSFTTVGSTVTSGNFHCNQGWVAVTGSGSLTITVTLGSVASGIIEGAGSEYSGISASPVDVSAMQAQSAPGLGSNAVTSGSATTTQNGELVVGFNVDFNGNVTTVAAGTGFAGRYSGTGNFQQEDEVQSSAGSIAATFTWQTSGGGDTGISGMIAFKAL